MSYDTFVSDRIFYSRLYFQCQEMTVWYTKKTLPIPHLWRTITAIQSSLFDHSIARDQSMYIEMVSGVWRVLIASHLVAFRLSPAKVVFIFLSIFMTSAISFISSISACHKIKLDASHLDICFHILFSITNSQFYYNFWQKLLNTNYWNWVII